MKPSAMEQAQVKTPDQYSHDYSPEPETSDSIVLHDSWSMSFIDLLTVLLTLFVLLLSFKNGGDNSKISVAAASTKHQIITIIHKDNPKTVAPIATTPDDTAASQAATESAEILKPKDTRMVMINDIVEKLNQDYVQDDTHNEVQVSATTNQINLEISEAILFTPASDELTPRGEEVLQQLAGVLVTYPFRLSVEGHTDNIPISSDRFPSNWELSTARATRVTRRLIDDGYPAASIRSIGYGDTQPLADNNTPEGRAKNRRVSIVMDLPSNDIEQYTRN